MASIIVVTGDEVGYWSWTDGFVPAEVPNRVLREEDVLARALWLERNGREDEAEEVIERFCS